MTYRAILLAGLVALSAAATRPAAADVYTVTYTGMTGSFEDTYGLFGAAGATVNDVAFTSTFTYDPSQFGTASQGNGAFYTYFEGGTHFGETDPLLSATLTINGHGFSQSSSFDGFQELISGDGRMPNIETSASATLSNYLVMDGYATNDFVLSSTATQSISFLPANTSGALYYDNEYVPLDPTGATVSDSPSATPVAEPASFALLAGAAGVFAATLGVRRTMSRRRPAPSVGLGFA
jgi:hypothetical protein